MHSTTRAKILAQNLTDRINAGEYDRAYDWNYLTTDQAALDLATGLAVDEPGVHAESDFIDVVWHSSEHQARVADAILARAAKLTGK